LTQKADLHPFLRIVFSEQAKEEHIKRIEKIGAFIRPASGILFARERSPAHRVQL
jgi:hypothetical protein